MAVTITTIQPQDSIASSRLTLNSNFAALKAGVDSLQVLLDPSTSILSGVKSATINDNAVSSSTTIFQVGKGSALLGNVIMGTTGASTSILINGNGGVTVDQSSITLTTGNLTLSSATSLASMGGHISVAKENRQPGVAAAFAAIIGLTSSSTTAVPVTDKKYIVLRNDGIVAGLTASLNSGSAAGQVIEIYHILGPSAYPVYIDTLNVYGLTGGITLSRTGDTLKCVWEGASWYLWNYSPSSFGATSGATASSIRFTTL
jgi:hypothetical protein